MKKHLATVKHDYIRYANCWEDADVLVQALAIHPGDRVLSIGSAGDNSFSLLTQSPNLVVAVDVNPIQLQLIQLKKAAIRALDWESFLQFLGFRPSTQRLALFQEIKQHLTSEEQAFWNNRLEELEAGIIYAGKFERYFKLFHQRILPFIHSSETIEQLFAEKSAEAQVDFFENQWNTWRWKLLFKVFFSKLVMGRFGRDPQFLKEVQVPVSSFILNQSSKHLSTVACQKNYFLQFILRGNFGDQLPHYARKDNFEKIKKNINRLIIFKGLAEDTRQEFGHFTKFNLSNIFEYMTPSLFLSVCQNLVEQGKEGARYAYWNLMVPRQMSTVSSSLMAEQSGARLFRQKDKGFFYAGLNLDIKQ